MKFSRNQARYIPSKLALKPLPTDPLDSTDPLDPDDPLFLFNLPLPGAPALRQLITAQNYLREKGIIRRLNFFRKLIHYAVLTLALVAAFYLTLLLIDMVCNAPLHDAWNAYLSRENTFDVTSLLESYDVVYNPGNEDERNVCARITISYDNYVLLSKDTVEYLTHPVILIRSPSGILHVDWLDIAAIRHSMSIDRSPYTIYIPFSTGDCTGFFGHIHAFVFSTAQRLTLFWGFKSIGAFAATAGLSLVALVLMKILVAILLYQRIAVHEARLNLILTEENESTEQKGDNPANSTDSPSAVS